MLWCTKCDFRSRVLLTISPQTSFDLSFCNCIAHLQPLTIGDLSYILTPHLTLSFNPAVFV